MPPCHALECCPCSSSLVSTSTSCTRPLQQRFFGNAFIDTLFCIPSLSPPWVAHLQDPPKRWDGGGPTDLKKKRPPTQQKHRIRQQQQTTQNLDGQEKIRCINRPRSNSGWKEVQRRRRIIIRGTDGANAPREQNYGQGCDGGAAKSAYNILSCRWMHPPKLHDPLIQTLDALSRGSGGCLVKRGGHTTRATQSFPLQITLVLYTSLVRLLLHVLLRSGRSKQARYSVFKAAKRGDYTA